MAVVFYTVLFGICLVMVLALNNLLNSYLRYPREEKSPPIRKRLNPFLTIPESPIEPVNSIGGWAVQESCRYPMEVLFFVHTAPSHSAHRAAYRDTLVHPTASSFFNWTMVFFIGQAFDDIQRFHWNRLEAEAQGDLVILPFLDTYRNLSAKFVGGMQWVLTYCPKVRYIVKLDDDLFVQPFRLTEYLHNNLKSDSRSLHCFVWWQMTVYRDFLSPYFVPTDLFEDQNYYVYCSGRSIIMSKPVMRDLYRWARLIPPYSVDDAYVTGDLALAAGVGHINMNERISWRSEDIFEFLDNSMIFVHIDNRHISVIRSMWRLILWDQAQRNSGFSSLPKYRRAFNTQSEYWKTIRAGLGLYKKGLRGQSVSSLTKKGLDRSTRSRGKRQARLKRRTPHRRRRKDHN